MSKRDKATEKTEEVHREDLRRIPRRHRATPADLAPRNTKVRITMHVDADVLEWFKGRAAEPGAPPYQTQMNAALRRAMEHAEGRVPGAELVDDDRFIEAVARRVREAR